ncbi:MAG TPA: DNA polymerase ligase N-terminal domain-containing protein [Polyangia bacterium]|nr:DNA polymerase ligase N-terminal domain-containing protein [Polyangia bacterium]
MALDEYNRKRDFGQTREPPGEVKRTTSGNLFVIQKHAASRLHYDFRLELDGVLLSWSVPKGPSLDPAQKRLAVHVEDHPLDYAMFEGIIPKGQYGGGTVLLWDRGTWTPETEGGAPAMLAAGNLKFMLKGEKLRGKYALVKIKERRAPGRRDDGRSWLLIKERDAEARPESELDITAARAESVATRRTMAQIAADPTHVWHSNRVQVALDDVPGARATPTSAPPRAAKPLARAAPPEGAGWLHEMQIEGRRLFSRTALNADVELFDERGQRLAPKVAAEYASVANAVRLLPAQSVVVDGVVTALHPDGRPRARGLAAALAGRGEAALAYYLTDLLFLDGHDLAETPLARRKALLAALIAKVKPPGIIRLSEHLEGGGAAFFREACRLGLPGMISRRADGHAPPKRGDAVLARCASVSASARS